MCAPSFLLRHSTASPKSRACLAVPELHKVYASVPGAGLITNLNVALGMIGLSSGTDAPTFSFY